MNFAKAIGRRSLEMEHACVLIVEDDPDIREVTKLFLSMLGHKSVAAENGKEALELLEKGQRPCVILLDLMMPIMDGWGFADAISQNEDFRQIPIIVVTAFADDAHSVKNARSILKKPLNSAQLKTIIQTYCA